MKVVCATVSRYGAAEAAPLLWVAEKGLCSEELFEVKVRPRGNTKLESADLGHALARTATCLGRTHESPVEIQDAAPQGTGRLQHYGIRKSTAQAVVEEPRNHPRMMGCPAATVVYKIYSLTDGP